MSFEGQIKRGLKWFNQRNNQGEYPDGIKNDPEKIRDINEYLKFIEGKDVAEVNKLIVKIATLAKHGQKKRKIYSETIEELKSVGAQKPEEKPKGKKGGK